MYKSLYFTIKKGYGMVVHIPGGVHTIKLMVQFMFTRHVAKGAKVIVVAFDTVPPHSCKLEATDIANHAMMLDPWAKIIYCTCTVN